MARKPNWKRRGLPRPMTEAERLFTREARRKSQRIAGIAASLPKEIRAHLLANPHLID